MIIFNVFLTSNRSDCIDLAKAFASRVPRGPIHQPSSQLVMQNNNLNLL